MCVYIIYLIFKKTILTLINIYCFQVVSCLSICVLYYSYDNFVNIELFFYICYIMYDLRQHIIHMFTSIDHIFWT